MCLTAISLAMLGAKENMKVLAVVPEMTTSDRICILKGLGAEVVRTPRDAHPRSEEGYFGLAKRIAAETPGSFVVDEVWRGFDQNTATTSRMIRGLLLWCVQLHLRHLGTETFEALA